MTLSLTPSPQTSLDRESVIVEGKLEAARESVVVLMDKKEVLEATRHGTLIKCLEEVNQALGGIYRRLTSVEGKDVYLSRNVAQPSTLLIICRAASCLGSGDEGGPHRTYAVSRRYMSTPEAPRRVE